MMSFLCALFLVISTGFAQTLSQAKVIQIQGEAANFLYQKVQGSDFINCYRALQQSGDDVVECELEVMGVTYEDQELLINGLAANEMYASNLNSKSVSCFTSLQTNGSSVVECKLSAIVTGKNY